MNISQNQTEKVRSRVSQCLESLTGGSGHLASYSIVPETFRISSIEVVVSGIKKYYFDADAYYESEFTVYDDDVNSDDPFDLRSAQTVSGYIALDDDYNLVRDDEGKVIFGPWNYSEAE